jgi:hypothetical protein
MMRFSTAALMSATAAACVLGVVTYAPMEADVRAAAFLGAVMSGASGALILLLKRLALGRKGMSPVFGAMALGFGLRGVLLGLGLSHTIHSSPLGFVLSFFCVYALQQTVELTWVVRAKGAVAT